MSAFPPIYRCARCRIGHPFGTLCPHATEDEKRRHADSTALAIDLAAILGLIRQGDVFASIDGLVTPPEVIERAVRWMLTMSDERARSALVLAAQALRHLTMDDPERLLGALGLEGTVAQGAADELN